MTWGSPEATWLLAAIPLWLLLRWRRLPGESVPFSPMQYARQGGSGLAVWALLALEGALLAAVVGVFAHPEERGEVERFGAEGVDIALVLDISASMQAADLKPNRLEVLKQLTSDLVRRSGDERVAVFAFARHCFTQTPLTTDRVSVLPLIAGLSLYSIDHSKSGGTAIGDALLVAGDALARERVAGRDQVVLLATDGQSNWGVDPVLAARFLRSEGIRLYAIGIGDEQPTPILVNGRPSLTPAGEVMMTSLDDTQLGAVVAEADGRYFRADSNDTLAAVFDEIGALETAPLTEERIVIVQSRAGDLAALALVLFAGWLAFDGFLLRRPLR